MSPVESTKSQWDHACEKGETELTERPHIRRTIRRCELSSLLVALESFRCSVLEGSGTTFPLAMIRIVGRISKVAQLARR